MATRKRIGLSLSFDNESNSGIVNYVISFVKGFKLLSDDMKPHLTIFYTLNAPLDQIKEIEYPYIRYYCLEKANLLKTFIDKIYFRIKRKVYFKNIVQPDIVDYIFPVFPSDAWYKRISNKIHWLVDFNAYYFPDHYKDKGEWFRTWHTEIVSKGDKVVLSSFSSYNDFKKFYPEHKNNVYILQFAAMLPVLGQVNITDVKEKFGIKGDYYITPNQFWEHKNHIVILKAMRILGEQNVDFTIVFTGSTKVNRGLGFQYDFLKEYVIANKLENRVHFLGIIERNTQLILMQNAHAIIQPSLFEGWSTLVEESKALNKYIILSDIPVHREQMAENCIFFDPGSPADLADKIMSFNSENPKPMKIDYSIHEEKFANDLIKLFN